MKPEDDYYDITIIELAQAVDLLEYPPVCLPSKKTIDDIHHFDYIGAVAFGNKNIVNYYFGWFGG